MVMAIQTQCSTGACPTPERCYEGYLRAIRTGRVEEAVHVGPDHVESNFPKIKASGRDGHTAFHIECDPFDLACFQCVENTKAAFSEYARDFMMRLAAHRVEKGSLHGFRLGTLTSTLWLRRAKAELKGRAKAEVEFGFCLAAAYDKWRQALMEQIERYGPFPI